MIEISLTSLKQFFESLGLACKSRSQDTFEWLEIQAGKDYADRPIDLILLASAVERPDPSVKARNFGHRIQFRYIFPFTVPKERISEVARYILLINKMIEFSGFGLGENDGVVYYKHDLHSSIIRVREDLLQGTFGYILFLIEGYGPALEALATGKKSLDQIMEEGA